MLNKLMRRIYLKQFTGYLHGINLGGWLSQCEHSKQHHDEFITESDIRRIAYWGMDHVRLPIDYEIIQTDQGEVIEDGFRYIDNCLKWCGEYGLNMILDLHKTLGYTFDEYETSADFFHSKEFQETFVDLWRELTRRYGKYARRLSFELLNEVVDPIVAQIWNGIAERAVTVIRQDAPTIPILIGGVENNSISALKLLAMPHDENIVYNFHFYEPLIFTHQSAYWIKEMPSDFSINYPNEYAEYCSKSEQYLPGLNYRLYRNLKSSEKADAKFFEAAFSEAVQIAEGRDVPLYCGEYGVIDKADVFSTLRWYTDINSTFQKYGIGSAVWNYKGKDFGITGKHYEPIFNDLIKLLA